MWRVRQEIGVAGSRSLGSVCQWDETRGPDNVPYGCDGYMSCFILIKPEVAHAFWDAVQANNLPRIRKIIADYDIPIWDELFASFPGSFDAAIHGILELKGLAQRWRRKPYYSLNNREMAQLADLLEGEGLAIGWVGSTDGSMTCLLRVLTPDS